jgi:hypothetical protein
MPRENATASSFDLDDAHRFTNGVVVGGKIEAQAIESKRQRRLACSRQSLQS